MAQKVVGVRGMHWEEVVGVEVLGKGRVEKEKPKKNPQKTVRLQQTVSRSESQGLLFVERF